MIRRKCFLKHMFDRAIMTKTDLLLLAVSCGAAVLFALFLTLFCGEGSRVRILCDGRLTGEYSLHEDREIPIRQEKGNNLLIIRDGEAWIEEADCPDGLCIRQGRISRTGESILCLPHELVITIAGKKDADAVDGMAG